MSTDNFDQFARDTVVQSIVARVWATGRQSEVPPALVLRVQAILNAVASGSLDEFRRHATADVTLCIEGAEHLPWVLAASGPEGFWSATMNNFAAGTGLVTRLYQVEASGEEVTLRAFERGCLAASGEAFAQHLEQRWTFRDGLLAEWHEVVTALPLDHPALPQAE